VCLNFGVTPTRESRCTPLTARFCVVINTVYTNADLFKVQFVNKLLPKTWYSRIGLIVGSQIRNIPTIKHTRYACVIWVPVVIT